VRFWGSKPAHFGSFLHDTSVMRERATLEASTTVRHSQVPNVLSLESPLYDRVGQSLAAMGHTVKSISGSIVGGVQVIEVVRPEAGPPYYRGGSDFRKDGQAVGW
jgi:gamma-glutamyltranspeptidase